MPGIPRQSKGTARTTYLEPLTRRRHSQPGLGSDWPSTGAVFSGGAKAVRCAQRDQAGEFVYGYEQEIGARGGTLLRVWRHRRCEGEAAAQTRAARLSSQMRKMRWQGADPEEGRQEAGRSAQLLTRSWIDFDQAKVRLAALGVAAGHFARLSSATVRTRLSCVSLAG